MRNLGNFGQTWWGEQWLSAFNGIDYSNRLPRGRRYANNGSVRDIEIKTNEVGAKVQGRRRSPYRIELKLDPFSARRRETIFKAVNSRPALLSRLLNRQLPHQMLDLMAQHDIRLFPRSWQDMHASCSCPDWAVPCKHIAAVIYLIANEIDKNPFLVFQLHGMDLAAEIETRTGTVLPTLGAPAMFIDDWSPELAITRWQPPPPSAFDAVDLTKVPHLEARLFTILSEKPLFHPKDFRQVLANQYKRTGRVAAKWAKSERTTWTEADRLRGLTVLIDENGRFQGAECEGEPLAIPCPHNGPGDEQLLGAFVERIHSIPASLEPHLSHAVVLWRTLLHLALKLIEQRAYMPEVQRNNGGDTLIQWRPATIAAPVKTLLESLYPLCPPDLLVLEHRPGRRRSPIRHFGAAATQIHAALNLFIGHFTAAGYQPSAEHAPSVAIGNMFFDGQPGRFDSFETAEYPKVIRHWLNRLHLAERPHRLNLQITERDGDRLALTIQVEHKEQLQHLAEILQTPNLSEIKVSVLADLAVMTDYFPEIERLYDTDNAAAELVFNLGDFTPVFQKTLPALRMLGIQVILPKALRNLAQPRLNLSLSRAGDDAPGFLKLDQLLQFDWQIAIGDQRLSVDEFRQLVRDASGIVRLLDQYVMIDAAQMAGLLKKLDDLPESLSRVELLKAGLAGELDGASVDLGDCAQALFDQLFANDPAPLPPGLNAHLRPYQQRGFEWLVQNARVGFGSLLADDMGLGKTLQVITFLLHLKDTGQLAKHQALIVAPTSLLTNWRREIERFGPGLNVHIYHGAQRNLDMNAQDILLTSYGLVRSDSSTLSKHRWRVLVIDEAQNIKNPQSAQTKAIKKLRGDIRIGMSGTPVENRLREYWSLFDFTNRGYLGTQKRFQEEFAAPIEKDRDLSRLERFRRVTAPFVLRRLKTDRRIIADLPEKIESNRYCNLTKEQASLYQSTVDSLMDELSSSGEGIERRGVIFKLLNALKQICNSPAQFRNLETAMGEESGKLAAFLEIMAELENSGEKALIFTQYTRMGNLLVGSLFDQLGWNVPFLHGGLSRTKRDDLVTSFQNDRGVRAMILSLKAGGTGLNLTAASQVVHYDLWWNPAVEAQATDRAYRIGQHKNVLVHRLITENTLEEKIDNMIQSKKELAELTVTSGEKWLSELSDAELRTLVAL